MKKEELKEILDRHQKWLKSEVEGERANLRNADLRGANLGNADLSGADLSGSDLSGAFLRDADLTEIIYNENTSFLSLQCPEKGSFIGYKKCCDELIVELKILATSKRSSATTRKCRCEKAKVLAIYNTDKTMSSETIAHSEHDFDFIYTVGKTVSVKHFDEDRWHECSTGIHFFLTFEEAKNYMV